MGGKAQSTRGEEIRVELGTLQLTADERRALLYANGVDGMASRNECRNWLHAVLRAALDDVTRRYKARPSK